MPPHEPRPLRGALYHPGGGFHSYPPPKNRTPQRRTCPHCDLPSETNARTCPVCGAKYEPRLLARIIRRFGRG